MNRRKLFKLLGLVPFAKDAVQDAGQAVESRPEVLKLWRDAMRRFEEQEDYYGILYDEMRHSVRYIDNNGALTATLEEHCPGDGDDDAPPHIPP